MWRLLVVAGAALLMAEYHLYLDGHRDVAKALLDKYKTPATAPAPASTTSGSGLLSAGLVLPAPTLTAKANPLVTSTAVAAARGACMADAGRFHGELAKSSLHWYAYATPLAPQLVPR